MKKKSYRYDAIFMAIGSGIHGIELAVDLA